MEKSGITVKRHQKSKSKVTKPARQSKNGNIGHNIYRRIITVLLLNIGGFVLSSAVILYTQNLRSVKMRLILCMGLLFALHTFYGTIRIIKDSVLEKSKDKNREKSIKRKNKDQTS